MKAPNAQVGNASGTELKFFNMWSILELESEFKARAHALRLDLNHRPQLLPETGRTTKIGIIQMASQQQAADCVERFHGQLMNGHALSVDLQMPKPVVRTAAIFGASRKTVAKKRSRKA